MNQYVEESWRYIVEMYWQQGPISNIPFASVSWSSDHQIQLLKWTLRGSIRASIGQEYQMQFTKRWIQAIEHQGLPVEEAVIECLAKGLMIEKSVEMSCMPSFDPIIKTYFLPSALISATFTKGATAAVSPLPTLEESLLISMVEDVTLIAHGTTGLRTWDSSFYLYHRLFHSNHRIKLTSQIVEFGSGCGLLGMALVSQGYHVIMTDGHPLVLQRLDENVKLNKSRIELMHSSKCKVSHHDGSPCRRPLQCQLLDWETVSLSTTHQPEWLVSLLDMDQRVTIVCSDCVYDPHGVNQQLAQALDALLCMFYRKQKPLDILIASTVRQPQTLQHFIQLLLSLKTPFSPKCIPFDMQIDFSNPLYTVESLNTQVSFHEPTYCIIHLRLE